MDKVFYEIKSKAEKNAEISNVVLTSDRIEGK